MHYLLLATLCSASIALVFKYSENNGLNRYAITTVNYIVAFSISLYMIIKSGVLLAFNVPAATAFANEFGTVIIQGQGKFSAIASSIGALGLGMITGISYLAGFIYYQRCVKEYGAGLSGTFSKLGIVIPLFLSMLLWNELPTSLQWVGIVLALASIVLINLSFDSKQQFEFQPLLLILFLTGGLGGLASKIFQMYALLDYKNVFLFFIFFTACIVSLYFTIKRKKKVTVKDVVAGIAAGVPNLFGAFFLLMALDQVPASLAYPVYSAGSIVMINIASMVFFSEKLARKELITIGMTVVALIFINI